MSPIDTFFNGQVLLSPCQPCCGLVNMLLLGLMAIGIGVPVGLLISLVRLYSPKVFRYLAIVYIDIFRAMPILVVLILIYYALPLLALGCRHGVRARPPSRFPCWRPIRPRRPVRHREHPEGSVRGGERARPLVHHDAAQGDPAAGGARRDPADDQQLRVDVQGHVARLDGGATRTAQGSQ